MVLLWSDVWNGNFLINKFPRLYSFTKNKNISVAQYISNQDIQRNFHIPLSRQALPRPRPKSNNSWGATTATGERCLVLHLGSNKYIPSRFYSLSYQSITPPLPFTWIWNMRVSKKIKIFIWLLFRDRRNLRNLLRRKNYKIDGDDYNCVLCNPSSASTHTTYSSFVPSVCNAGCSFVSFGPFTLFLWHHTTQQGKDQCHHKFFMEVFSIAAWKIWKQCNSKNLQTLGGSFPFRSETTDV